MYYNILIDRPVGDFSHRFKCYGAVAALLGTAMNAAYQDKQNEENRQAQNDMLTRQQNFQRELNANSALVQMQSLKKAGLSPNLMSGNPAYNATASLGDSSPLQAPQIDVSAVSSLLQQQPLVEAQAENIRADTAKKNAEIQNINVDTLLKDTQNWALRQKTPAEVKQLEKNTELLHEEMNRVKWDSKQIEANIELTKSKQANIDVDTSFLLDSYDTRLGQLVAAVSELQSRNSLNIAQACVAYKSIEVMSHQIREIESRVSLNQKQWLYLDSQITNLCIDGDFKQFQLNIEKQFGKEKAKLILEQINEDVLNTRSQMYFRPVGMLIGAVGAGAALGNLVK